MSCKCKNEFKTDLSAEHLDSRFVSTIFELASEISVLRDRLHAAEELLERKDILAFGEIDSHHFTEERNSLCNEERTNFIKRVVNALSGKTILESIRRRKD